MIVGLKKLGIINRITLIPADLTDMSSLLEAVSISDPDEIYNLAAQSYVGNSFDQPLLTTDIDASGTTRFLEIIRHLKKDIKFHSNEWFKPTRTLNADDIVFTFRRQMPKYNPQKDSSQFWGWKSGSAFTNYLADVNKLDDYKVTFIFTKPLELKKQFSYIPYCVIHGPPVQKCVFP